SEHIKQLLVGNILTVTPAEVGTLALLYAPIAALHWLVRRPLLDISFDPDGAGARRAVPWWDFVFYASFGLVVTSSVRLAGVLLVFAYLVVPATAGALLARAPWSRLAVGGAPAAPAAHALFLRVDERETYRDAQEGVERSVAELGRVRAMQEETQWGTRPMSEDTQERVRQYLAGRTEMLAGDRMVLRTLRARARERQRWSVGLPLLGIGAGGALWLLRRRRAQAL